jgi:DNA-directed RNA polymerase subunit beta
MNNEAISETSAKLFFNDYFFDAKRYDLSEAGRYKLNRKLSIVNRVRGMILAEDITLHGKAVILAGTLLLGETLSHLQEAIEAGACRYKLEESDLLTEHVNIVKI